MTLMRLLIFMVCVRGKLIRLVDESIEDDGGALGYIKNIFQTDNATSILVGALNLSLNYSWVKFITYPQEGAFSIR